MIDGANSVRGMRITGQEFNFKGHLRPNCYSAINIEKSGKV
jgi:hypothetical protein